MRRTLYFILVILMSVMVISCKGNDIKKESNEKQGDKFNSKIATQTVKNYLEAISKGDINTAKKLSIEKMWDKSLEFISSDINISGYRLEDTNELKESLLIKVKVSRVSNKDSRANLDSYSIKVIKEDTEDYKISDINVTTEKEAFYEEGEIRIRNKDNVKTNLLIDKSGIPQYGFSKNDKGSMMKISIPKTNFGVIAFSFSGERIAVTTYDKDSFVSIIKLDDSLMVQGGNSNEQGGGGNGGDKEANKVKVRETPVGKEILSLDILKDTMIKNLCFSLDEKYFMTQYEIRDKGTGVRVYDVDKGNLLEVDLEKEFPIEEFSVTFYSFDKDGMIFDVGAKESKDREKEGRWKLEFKDMKLTKM